MIEALKKAFINENNYDAYAGDTYLRLFNEEQLKAALVSIDLGPHQADTELDLYSFETMLTTLYNKKFITMEQLGNTDMAEAAWRRRYKGPLHQAFREGLVNMFQSQPEQLMASRISETGGSAVLTGEELDASAMKLVLDDPTVAAALAYAEQSLANADKAQTISLRNQCWQTLFADQLRPDNVRRLLLEMHRQATKSATSLLHTTSTTSSSTSSSTFDIAGAGMFSSALETLLAADSSGVKAKFKGALVTLIRCFGASLDKLILTESVESARARPMVLLQGHCRQC